METEDGDSNDWSDVDDDGDVNKDEEDAAGELKIDLGRKARPRKNSRGSRLAVSARKRKIKKEKKSGPRRTAEASTKLISSKSKSSLPSTSEEAIVIDPAFDANLERTANKLNMNRTQVKTVLRRVIESPDLIKMILDKAGEDTTSPDLEEIRLTRRKARDVKESGGTLDWLAKFDHVTLPKTPLKAGAAASSGSLAVDTTVIEDDCDSSFVEFLTQIRSSSAQKEEAGSHADLAKAATSVDDTDDDEEDQEYDPSKDPDVMSDEDDSVLNSDAGTPHQGSVTPASTSSLSTPKPSLTKEYGEYFKQPFSSSPGFRVARVLDFESDVVAGETPDQRMTRQRTSLKNVTIEELEAKFVPPDLTPDLYYYDGDEDYENFLSDCFYKPLVDDDAQLEEFDPDFNLLKEEMETPALGPAESSEEFRFDRSTKIPNREVEVLLSEIVDDFDHQYPSKISEPATKRQKHDSAKEQLKPESEPAANSTSAASTPTSVPAVKEVLTPADLEVVLHQLCQHVQLLTQTTLLTASEDETSNAQCKQMSMELLGQVLGKEHFAPVKVMLSDGVDLINSFEKEGGKATVVASSSRAVKCRRYELSQSLLGALSQSTAFRYPTLLPDNCPAAFRDWSESEDYVLALGMEFAVAATPDAKKRDVLSLSKIIQERLVRGKTAEQICKRIKNQKTRAARDHSNPLTCFFLQGQAGRLPRLPEFVLPEGATVRSAPAYTLTSVWKTFLGMPDEPKPKQSQSKQLKSQRSQQPYPQPATPINNSDTAMTSADVQHQSVIMLQYGSTSIPIPFTAASMPEMASFISPVKTASPEPATVAAGLKRNESDQDRNKFVNILDMVVEECGISGISVSPAKTYSPAKIPDRTTREEAVESAKDSLASDAARGDDRGKGTKRPRTDSEQARFLTEDETEEEACARKEAEATALLNSAREQLDAQKMADFVQVLIANEDSPVSAFPLLNTLCADHPELQLMLLDLLSPAEAAALDVTDAFACRQRQKAFFRMLRRSGSPERNAVVLAGLSAVFGADGTEGPLTAGKLTRAAESLFAENGQLKETFLALVPKA